MTLKRVRRAVAVGLAVIAGIWAGHALTSGPAPATPDVRPVAATLTALDRARVDGRAALAQSRTARGQALVAGRLAREHRAAGGTVRDVPALSNALGTVADAYTALEHASTAGSRSGFRAARASVLAAEARLARELSSMTHPAIEPAPESRTQAIVVPALLLALIAFGLAVTRLRKPPAAKRDAALPPTGWLAVDPVGRWDSPY